MAKNGGKKKRASRAPSWVGGTKVIVNGLISKQTGVEAKELYIGLAKDFRDADSYSVPKAAKDTDMVLMAKGGCGDTRCVCYGASAVEKLAEYLAQAVGKTLA